MPGFESEIVARRQHVRGQLSTERAAPIVVDAPGSARIEALLADLTVLAANVGRLPGVAPAYAQDIDARLVELRALLGQPGAPEQPAAPDLGEFAVRTLQLVYLESAPGSWVTGPDLDPEFEFDPFLDRHLPEPFRSAALALGRGAMDGYRCWTCAREVVGWAETIGEGPHGEEVYGMTWAAVGLLFEPESGDPVNAVCETCTPFVLSTPAPEPPRRFLPTVEVSDGD